MRTPLLLVLMFILAIGAGLVAGRLTNRVVSTVPTASTVRNGTISDQLQLSADQKEQMRQIWEAVQGTSNDCTAKARKIQYDYEEAVIKLLNKDQQAEYQKLTQESKRQVKELEARRRTAFQKAVEQTKQMLNEPQRKIYETIIKDRVGPLSDPDSAAP